MLAIIPARGGSKGLPGKNIMELNGKPLIAWTIEAAFKSQFIDNVIVSTDDKKIADISLNSGASIPFMRPANLADDKALAIDVYFYTINRLFENTGVMHDSFVVLQPTSPLRKSDDIDNAINIFRQMDADSVISVVESPHPIEWTKKIDEDGVLRYFFSDGVANKNRQDNAVTYIPNGAIFIFKTEFLKIHYTYYSEKTYPYIMPRERSVDIDDIIDFKFAEFLMRYNG